MQLHNILPFLLIYSYVFPSIASNFTMTHFVILLMPRIIFFFYFVVVHSSTSSVVRLLYKDPVVLLCMCVVCAAHSYGTWTVFNTAAIFSLLVLLCPSKYSTRHKKKGARNSQMEKRKWTTKSSNILLFVNRINRTT